MAVASKAADVHASAIQYGRSMALIVASGFLSSISAFQASDAPAGLLKQIALRETENEHARENYTYRQSVLIQEFDEHNKITGQYRETRDITFSPNGARYENVVERPWNTLSRLRLTPEDFADIRNVQPFLLTGDELPLYEGRFQGEELMDGTKCFVERIQPRQILATQRFFEGTLWVRQSDSSVLRSEGQAVPQIETFREQNLFPHFTTIRREIDDKWFFPVETYADDTLFFRRGPQRIRIVIRYSKYQHFEAKSTISFPKQ